ncbi:hypothetical protein WICMUC_003625 [Wickerhamomyces mucosus]|uniref:Uncharacterized protein n=1 Tax=Wickerhamomyces mucosus TaxID=1378264 RepID=A0A9P8TCB9_9ASCO|nr:hypothetical protein WICMUC_003625 [Wickerhamomyces mucosus]
MNILQEFIGLIDGVNVLTDKFEIELFGVIDFKIVECEANADLTSIELNELLIIEESSIDPLVIDEVLESNPSENSETLVEDIESFDTGLSNIVK